MLALGPVGFAAPLALIALIGLPLLWLILRASPPQPKEIVLPSLALFHDVDLNEETPDTTPWWVILLRILAVSLAIIGLAQPVWNPTSSDTEAGGASQRELVVIATAPWTSAPGWSEQRRSALAALSAIDRDRSVRLLQFDGRANQANAMERLSPQEVSSRLQAMEPVAWLPDPSQIEARLNELNLADFDTLWITDGRRHEGHDALLTLLRDEGDVQVIRPRPSNMIAIDGLSRSPDGPELSLVGSSTAQQSDVAVSARNADGRSLVTLSANFESGSQATKLVFDVPEQIQTEIASFKVIGQNHAGGLWQWDGSNRTRRVGLYAEGTPLQPLLSDTYYVEKALAPFAEIISGDLDTLLSADLNAIVLTDVGQLSDSVSAELENWIRSGGVLIRFAGPRLASQSDRLIPVRLRRASRAFDSALSWETPQTLADVADTSPFAALNVPEGISVRRQVLAQPDPQLSARTWARLEDGTPLVTSSPLGQGRLVLFHVTAGPSWSDLPLSGLYVQMLQKVTLPARDMIAAVPDDGDVQLTPVRWLNGYGEAEQPDATAQNLLLSDLAEFKPQAGYPAGLYEGGAVRVPLNAAAAGLPDAVLSWPNDVTLLEGGERQQQPLAGWLLFAAGVLVAIDLLVALFLSGRLRGMLSKKAGNAAALLLTAALATGIHAPSAQAQGISAVIEGVAPENQASIEAALTLRFAFIRTGDSQLDRVTEAGLTGLSRILYFRTTVEPQRPVGVDLETDQLHTFPLLFLSLPDDGFELTETSRTRLGAYLRNGGALIIDTRAGGNVGVRNLADARLTSLLEGLDVPPLTPVPDDHVLTRSFYLIDEFTGRYPDRPVWIEMVGEDGETARVGDAISGLFITDADFSAAWAVNSRGRPLQSVEGGERNRELAYRTGVNIVMYILTGTYKDDQVHLPLLLERLGQTTGTSESVVDDDDTDGPPTDIRPDTEEDQE